MSAPGEEQRVAVVGGGLVGALNACYLARRGFHVDLYEYRDDIREAKHVQGRSINLALSHRGRSALAGVGLEEKVTSIGIPMRARMIHDLSGKRRAIPYGTSEQYIMSVDRRKLNEYMLSFAEDKQNVRLMFNHKLISCDPDTGTMTFQLADGSEVERRADVIMGNDGAYSAVRAQLMKRPLFNYSQEYIPHGYKELCMRPSPCGRHAMEVNYLHIWPRGQFMMIALPNLDNTYTVTLFMPFDIFESIKTREDLLEFFKSNFPDSIDLLGEDALVQDYFSVQPQPLVSIKCSPYHVGGQLLLMGDAAHGMVPFYGQGMNAGFEDCIILHEVLTDCNDDFALALPRFSENRIIDAQAICDLAMYNYVEMRDLVNSRKFLMRKKLDSFLHYLFPHTWVPLYTSVSFTRMRYHQCIKNREWQDRIITGIISAISLTTAVSIASVSLICLVRYQPSWIARLFQFVSSNDQFYFAPAGRIITSPLKPSG